MARNPALPQPAPSRIDSVSDELPFSLNIQTTHSDCAPAASAGLALSRRREYEREKGKNDFRKRKLLTSIYISRFVEVHNAAAWHWADWPCAKRGRPGAVSLGRLEVEMTLAR